MNEETEAIAALQRRLIEAMKRGGRLSTAHKEGGSHFFWQEGKFIRSDFGDFPDLRTYSDEAAYLQMLWRSLQYEVTRAEDGTKLSELEGWKRLLRRMEPTSHVPQAAGPVRSVSALKSMVALVVLGLVGVGMAAWQFLTIESTGVPLGLALKSPTHVLQLISTTERYLPKLHRSLGKDRYRIDLLAVSISNPEQQEMFTLLRQKQSNALTPMTKILGVDGDVVWIQALDVFAVNLKTKRIAREADLRKANPELELFFASAKPYFTDRFFAVSPDWSRAYEFSAETLKATACNPPERGNWLDEQSKGRLEHSLCAGGLISADEWMSVATPEEAKVNYKPGFSLPRDFTASEKDHPRHLYHGRADTTVARPKFLSADPLSDVTYRAASFLRSEPRGSLLQVSNPVSVFMLHRVGSELFAPYSLTRLGSEGNPLWSANTEIGLMAQVLPGEQTIALIGERTPVPGKVPEPILVLINVGTGSSSTVSFWR